MKRCYANRWVLSPSLSLHHFHFPMFTPRDRRGCDQSFPPPIIIKLRAKIVETRMRADKTRLEFIESIPFSCSTLCTLFTIIAPLVSRVKRVVSRSFILYYFPRNWRTQRAHAHFKSRDNSPIILVFLLLLRTRKKSSFDLLIILFFFQRNEEYRFAPFFFIFV